MVLKWKKDNGLTYNVGLGEVENLETGQEHYAAELRLEVMYYHTPILKASWMAILEIGEIKFIEELNTFDEEEARQKAEKWTYDALKTLKIDIDHAIAQFERVETDGNHKS